MPLNFATKVGSEGRGRENNGHVSSSKKWHSSGQLKITPKKSGLPFGGCSFLLCLKNTPWEDADKGCGEEGDAREDRWVAWLTVHGPPRWAVKPGDKSSVAANGWRREICLLSLGLLSTRRSDFDHEAPAASSGLTRLGQNTISCEAIIDPGRPHSHLQME
ncbi:hypothetical protein JTE90_021613 [Oedothorax gibbosus]|uniref:Uncharacterized protein n=1 Tax=Oedothorax gibbosus TaxID=931172 RepID=A0AAV6VQQ0_9ARAC|nr:hypothetical protein JTE90_021613 [Oedothorax gibbosus]